jgi:hypothetical protein
MLLNTNPFLTILFMIVIRGFFVGFASGAMFKGFSKLNAKGTWSFEATALLTALLNTTMFVLGVILIFGNHAGMREMIAVSSDAGRSTVLVTWLTLIWAQALIEMAVCTLIAATIARVIKTHLHKV